MHGSSGRCHINIEGSLRQKMMKLRMFPITCTCHPERSIQHSGNSTYPSEDDMHVS